MTIFRKIKLIREIYGIREYINSTKLLRKISKRKLIIDPIVNVSILLNNDIIKKNKKGIELHSIPKGLL